MSKANIARSFAKSAHCYDQAAHIQRQIADDLFNRLTAPPTGLWLDLGCGTGYAFDKFQPTANVLGLDLAFGMIQQAQSRQPLALVQGDAEALPLQPHSIDGCFSSLAVQWCHHLPLLFSECHRVLKPGGTMMMSTLLPGTLVELKQAWAQVLDEPRVNRFFHPEDWYQAATEAGFRVSAHQQRYVLSYEHPKRLLKDLNAIGAQTLVQRKSRQLISRQQLQAMYHHYPRSKDGSYPASYEVLMLELIK